jgi:hypothetical protein
VVQGKEVAKAETEAAKAAAKAAVGDYNEAVTAANT